MLRACSLPQICVIAAALLSGSLPKRSPERVQRAMPRFACQAAVGTRSTMQACSRSRPGAALRRRNPASANRANPFGESCFFKPFSLQVVERVQITLQQDNGGKLVDCPRPLLYADSARTQDARRFHRCEPLVP